MNDRAGRAPHLRVYWVNQYVVPPDQPGGTRHFDFAAELGRRGHDVRLVGSDLNLPTRSYSRRRGPWDRRAITEEHRGVHFAWLTAGSYHANDWRRIVSMGVFAALAFVHLLRQPTQRGGTVFIGSSPQLFAALATWAAARIRRVPFVFEVRDLWPESYTEVSGKERGPEIVLMRRVADLLYRRARRIIVLAAPNAERIVARGVAPETVVVVPNGVDLHRFDEAAASVDLSRPGTFAFVYAGAHGPANDLETVVRACEILRGRGRDDIRVVLLGDGPSKEELVGLVDTLGLSNVDFVDPVPKSAIPGTLRTADAGLMVLAPVELFSYGVSPNKLFDYMGAGLPVLTNVPGLVSDIVAEAGVGRSVVAGDALALADGMEALAEHPPPDARERGRRYVAEHHDRRELARRIEEILTDLGAQPARR